MSTLTGTPYGQTEVGAAYSEAAQRARAHAEANHPARLLGVAQQAMRDALLLDDVAQIKTYLTTELARITESEIPA